MKNRNITSTKICLLKRYVFPVFLSGCKFCTMSNEMVKKNGAVKMCMFIFIRVLKISWAEKTTSG